LLSYTNAVHFVPMTMIHVCHFAPRVAAKDPTKLKKSDHSVRNGEVNAQAVESWGLKEEQLKMRVHRRFLNKQWVMAQTRNKWLEVNTPPDTVYVISETAQMRHNAAKSSTAPVSSDERARSQQSPNEIFAKDKRNRTNAIALIRNSDHASSVHQSINSSKRCTPLRQGCTQHWAEWVNSHIRIFLGQFLVKPL